VTIAELQQLVRRSHEQHFGNTELRERLRDLQHQVAELVHHRDLDHLKEELGDVTWSLLQLHNELRLEASETTAATCRKLDAKARGKKVCLLGTSANPITNAHLTMGLEILALTDVDEVWYYLPAKHPWGKKLLPAEHRLEMVRRATARYPRLKAFDFEIEHGERIYATTKETAPILRDFILPAFPEYRFSWVMGSDVAQRFHEWGGHDWMAAHLDVYVIHRLGYDFDKASSPLADARHLYLRDNIVTTNISSTLVRERGKEYRHDRLLALVPDVVWDYLVEHRLLDPEALG
jgi:nicotinate-nucleotide adenylyltransferase